MATEIIRIPNLKFALHAWSDAQNDEAMASFRASFQEMNARIPNNSWLVGEDFQTLMDSDSVFLASHLWPTANAQELRMTIEVVTWSTAWDIFVKRSARQHPNELANRIDESKRLVKKLVENRSLLYGMENLRWPNGILESLRYDDPMASIPRILASMSDVYGPAYLEVFKKDFCDYMDAITAEQSLMANGRIPAPYEYWAHHSTAAHIPPLLRIIPIGVCEFDKSNRSPFYNALLSDTYRIMRITNDLFSLEEDLRMGNVWNSVILRFHCYGNIQCAVREVRLQICDAREAFDRTSQRAMLVAEKIGTTEDYQLMIDFLRQMYVGHWKWCMKNKRYGMSEHIQSDGTIEITLATSSLKIPGE